MNKKVLILGSTGMLGNAVYGVLKDKYSLIITARTKEKIDLLEKAHGGTANHKFVEFDALKVYEDYLAKKGNPGEYLTNFLKEVGEIDYAINAIGITIPYIAENPAGAFFINGALPHILANALGEKLIHITTDCVYSGKEGFPYDEDSPKTPTDVYGLAKSLGEPTSCLTIRTSIIGRELEGFSSLLEWFLAQKGKEVNGFGKHFWNGVTTKEFGKICDKIMSEPEKYPKKGIYHVFSNAVSKYEMVKKFEDKYKIGCTIKEETTNALNRTMSTVKGLNGLLNVPSFDQMVDDL